MKLSAKLLGIILISLSMLTSCEHYIEPMKDCTNEGIFFSDSECPENLPGITHAMGWIPEPEFEEVHLTYHVGDIFTLTTPNDKSGDFCRWRFIQHDLVLNDEEGIRRVEESGVIKLMQVTFDEKIRVLMLSSDFPCDLVNQLIATFKAVNPGRVVFYVQNKPAWKVYKSCRNWQHCSCKPTIRKYTIDVIA